MIFVVDRSKNFGENFNRSSSRREMFPAAFVFSVTPRDADSEARVKRLAQKKAGRRFATGCFKMQKSLFIIRRGARK